MAYQSIHTGQNIDDGISINASQNVIYYEISYMHIISMVLGP